MAVRDTFVGTCTYMSVCSPFDLISVAYSYSYICTIKLYTKACLLFLFMYCSLWVVLDFFLMRFYLSLLGTHECHLNAFIAAWAGFGRHLWVRQWYLEFRLNATGVCTWTIPLPTPRKWGRVDEFLWASSNHCWPASSCCPCGPILPRILLFHFSLVSWFIQLRTGLSEHKPLPSFMCCSWLLLGWRDLLLHFLYHLHSIPLSLCISKKVIGSKCTMMGWWFLK